MIVLTVMNKLNDLRVLKYFYLIGVLLEVAVYSLKESLSKPRPRRKQPRKHHQTKDLMNRTMAVHVHYKSLYIF